MSDGPTDCAKAHKVKEFRQWDTDKMNHSQKVTENVTLGEQPTILDLGNQYYLIGQVLQEALLQCAHGKGKERHADDDPFDEQPIMWIEEHFKSFQLGQAVKKIHESQRLDKEAAIAELLGAINYIAAQVIYLKMSERTGIGVK